ncbi:MAG: hypothetical protein E4H14_13980 [Candidatus Thorarchaeota archaeon]|nr:MAG: hypothetical protein E4H14_13980 [Candidatus Thorarchaeota archaeon]
MMEIRVGESKIKITNKFRPNYNSSSTLTKLTFPQKVDNTKDRIIVTLLYCYPNGLTSDVLASITDAKLKTVVNWLTESSKGITDNFEKDGEEYKIRSNNIYWALDEFDVILQNLK